MINKTLMFTRRIFYQCTDSNHVIYHVSLSVVSHHLKLLSYINNESLQELKTINWLWQVFLINCYLRLFHYNSLIILCCHYKSKSKPPKLPVEWIKTIPVYFSSRVKGAIKSWIKRIDLLTAGWLWVTLFQISPYDLTNHHA